MLLTVVGCKKEDNKTTKSLVTAGFTWSENGGATITADSAYFAMQYNAIKAFKSGNFIEINFTAGTAATYTVVTTNAISYLAVLNFYTATSGSVIVSANALSKMSGTFTSAGSGASITSLSGTINNINIR